MKHAYWMGVALAVAACATQVLLAPAASDRDGGRPRAQAVDWYWQAQAGTVGTHTVKAIQRITR